MDTQTRRPARLRRGEKALFVTVGVVLAAIAALTMRWQIAMRKPVAVIPAPRPPNPNALDLYREAARSVRGPVGSAVSTNVREKFTWAEKERLVADNAEALRTLRRGFALDSRQPAMRSLQASTGAETLRDSAALRELARLLVLESRVRAHRGDAAGALNSALDTIRLGTDLGRGAALGGDLISLAIQAIGRAAAREALSGQQATKIPALVMEAIRARQAAWADILQEEKWSGQAVLLDLFRNSTLAAQVSGNRADPPNAWQNATSSLFFLIYPKQRIFDAYTRDMDARITRARQPWSRALPDPPPTGDPLSRAIGMPADVFQKAWLQHTVNDTQNALLTAELALRAYRAERGEYPQTLDALVPSVLRRVPGDPFAPDPDAPLRYRRTGSGFRLYSIGPDGVDDGGKPVAAPTRAGRRARIAPDSRGDIVPG